MTSRNSSFSNSKNNRGKKSPEQTHAKRKRILTWLTYVGLTRKYSHSDYFNERRSPDGAQIHPLYPICVRGQRKIHICGFRTLPNTFLTCLLYYTGSFAIWMEVLFPHHTSHRDLQMSLQPSVCVCFHSATLIKSFHCLFRCIYVTYPLKSSLSLNECFILNHGKSCLNSTQHQSAQPQITITEFSPNNKKKKKNAPSFFQS